MQSRGIITVRNVKKCIEGKTIMKKTKILLAGLLVISVLVAHSAVAFAQNDPFEFHLIPFDNEGPNVKEDTDPAVVNTLYASNTSNIVGYAVICFNSYTGDKEYATSYTYYSGTDVFGRKYLYYYDGYGWIGAYRYLEGNKLLNTSVTVEGRWAS